MTSRHLPDRAAALVLAALAAACTPQSPQSSVIEGKVAYPADGVAAGISMSDARFLVNITAFQGPESVRYDPDQDVFFVSNMTGYGSAKDGNGYISVVNAADPRESRVFVQGGKNGAVLDSPKGMAIHGDTLWVADINILRGFDRHTGAPLANIDFTSHGVALLNDVAVGPDGTVRVTDTGIRMDTAGIVPIGPDHIYAVGPGGAISVVAEGPQLREPNGITWDPVTRRWIVVSFDAFVGEVATMPNEGAERQVIRTGKGRLDGVEVLPNGAILFSSWADSSVHLLEHGRESIVVRELPVPADIGVDTKRNRLAVPLSSLGRVQLWSLGPIGRGADTGADTSRVPAHR